jgi:putative membrane protein
VKSEISNRVWQTTGFWLFAATLGFLALTAVNPYDRFTWFLENVWVVAGLGIVAWMGLTGRTMTGLLAWALCLHAIILIYGGWYTYEHTPFGNWMRDAFGFERNHYDRIGHFVQGFFPAVLYREVLVRFRAVNGAGWRELLVFAVCMAFTAIFEILEFLAAAGFGSDSDSYLGMQGDIWDAQWDMLYCGFGAVVSIALLCRWHMRQLDSLRDRNNPADGT